MAYLTQHNVSSLNKSVVISGTLLGLASLLEILAMAHHPSVRTLDISQAVARVARLSHFTALAHGVLIGLMLVIAYGMSDFVLFRGPRRPLMRAGCIAYFAGVVSMIGAALVSGWVIADVASLTPHVTEIDRQINAQLFTLCSVVNQTCANFGVVAMSAGIGFWSLDLLRDVGFQRIVGVIGCAISLGLIGALTGGALHLDVSGMDNVVQLQAVWNIAAGATLVTYGVNVPRPRLILS